MPTNCRSTPTKSMSPVWAPVGRSMDSSLSWTFWNLWSPRLGTFGMFIRVAWWMPRGLNTGVWWSTLPAISSPSRASRRSSRSWLFTRWTSFTFISLTTKGGGWKYPDCQNWQKLVVDLMVSSACLLTYFPYIVFSRTPDYEYYYNLWKLF